MSESSDAQTANGYNRLSPLHASADAIPLLVDGTYHLFHLTTPPNTTHHPARLRSSWTRLRSSDLQTWTRDAEPAITPGKSASDPDADGAWTGSAVIGPDDTMHIFYTGYNLSQAGRQVILHARSTDKHGTRFTKDAAPITITSPPSHRAAFEAIDFRDPFVFWHAPTARFWMLVATRLADGPYWTRGCLALLTSPDLAAWSLDPAPFYAPNDLLCPECPELFALPNGKWYLVYSRFAAPHAGTVYRVGDSARGPFRIPRDGSAGLLDGRRWYAAKSCARRGRPDRRVFFGWTGDWCEHDAKWLWGGDLALPREVWAADDGSLRVEPVPEALDALLERRAEESVRWSRSVPASLRLSGVGTTATRFLDPPCPLAQPLAQPYLLSFALSPPDTSASSIPAGFGILLRTSPSSLRGHRIVFRPLPNPVSDTPTLFSVTLQTDIPPLDDFWADQYRLYVARGVDGPEIVRHDAVALFEGGGGQAEKKAVVRLLVTAEEVDGEQAEVQEIGFFVQDGEVLFEELTIR
ncbi:glycosyl hydrolase [Phyllosticta citribraziliensis]|uniref:beta-fructofuranosidase n=1 Tax=Phyllosticta citribraziliensis TaxID=989973 RepID=A0ABR1LM19_9PEZI